MSDKEYDINIKTSYDDSGMKKANSSVDDQIKKLKELESQQQKNNEAIRKQAEIQANSVPGTAEHKGAQDSRMALVRDGKKYKRAVEEVRQEMEKLGMASEDVSKTISEFAPSLDKAAKSAENISVSTNNVHNTTLKTAGGFKNIGYGALQASYFIDDMQYGMKGIMNNIPGLVMGFGGGMGLAGALGIGVVAANQLWNWLDKSDKSAGKLEESISKTSQEIQDKLTEESLKLDIQYDDENIKNIQKLLSESLLKPLETLNKEADKNITSLQEEVRLQSILAAKKKDLDTTSIELERQRAKTALIKKEINQDEYELKMLELDQKLSNLGRDSQIDDKQRNLDYLNKVRENQGGNNEILASNKDRIAKAANSLGLISPDGNISDKTKLDLSDKYRKALEERMLSQNDRIADNKGRYYDIDFLNEIVDSLKSGKLDKGGREKEIEKLKPLIEALRSQGHDIHEYDSILETAGKSDAYGNNITGDIIQSWLKDSSIIDIVKSKENRYREAESVVQEIIKAINGTGMAYVKDYGADTSKGIAEQLQSYIAGVESVASSFSLISTQLKENEASIDKLDSEIKESLAEIEALKEVSQAKKAVQKEEHGNKLLDQQEKQKERERQALLAKEKERIEKQNRSAPDRTRRQQEAYVDQANIGRHLPNNPQALEVTRNVENIIKESLADNQLSTREQANIEKLAREQASSLKMTSEAFISFMKDVKGLFGTVNTRFTELQNQIAKGDRELRDVKYKMSQSGKAR